MAIGALSVGEKPPDVIVPASVPSPATISVSARAGARPSGRMPTRRRGVPFSSWSRITAAPGKSQVARRRLPITQARSASIGEVSSSMSLP